MMMLILLIPIMLLTLLFISLNYLLSKTPFFNREKSSPFECGFDPIHLSHSTFSVQFFMISLIFLIFDIEITMLIPLIYYLKKYSWYMISYFILFMFILILGLYLEYLESMIDWKI